MLISKKLFENENISSRSATLEVESQFKLKVESGLFGSFRRHLNNLDIDLLSHLF